MIYRNKFTQFSVGVYSLNPLVSQSKHKVIKLFDPYLQSLDNKAITIVKKTSKWGSVCE